MNHVYHTYFTVRETAATHLKQHGFHIPEKPPLPLCPTAILTVSQERPLDGALHAPSQDRKGTKRGVLGGCSTLVEAPSPEDSPNPRPEHCPETM